MGVRDTVRAIERVLEDELCAAALASVEFDRDGRHMRVSIAHHSINLICPRTPSDHRWIMNWRAELRRQIARGPRRMDHSGHRLSSTSPVAGHA